MAKTRSQTGNITIKKEEKEDRKPSLLLIGVSNTSKRRNKITKREPSKSKNNLPAQKVKVEEDTDTKSLLKSASNHSKLSKGRLVSQEQINQLIDYVVNHGMSITKASRMAKMSQSTGCVYYHVYNNDPDKKIPAPRKQHVHAKESLTQEQVENLIRYIVDEKMTVPQASTKANMACESGRRYYKKYLKDPDHSIPIPLYQHYTQDQKNELIGYIVNDKMSINQASKKAKINNCTARKYYHKYFKDQHPDIPTPSHIVPRRDPYSQEQISKVISYIIDDKMTIAAASRKVNMSRQSAGRHYRRYLKDNNMELPVPKYCKRYTQAEINKVVGYIADDKMLIRDASKKANMPYSSAIKYYREYQKKHDIYLPALKYRQDKIKEIAGYVINDKMSVRAAAKKANVSVSTGHDYYQKYLMDKKRDAPS